MKSSVNSFSIFCDYWTSGGTNCCNVAEKTNCDVFEECSQCYFCRDGKWKSRTFSPVMFKLRNGWTLLKILIANVSTYVQSNAVYW